MSLNIISLSLMVGAFSTSLLKRTLFFLLLAFLALVLFHNLFRFGFLLTGTLHFFDDQLDFLSTHIYFLQVNIGGVFERIQLAHRCLDLIGELMGSHALQNTKVLICEDDVALRIKFQDEMITELLLPEG